MLTKKHIAKLNSIYTIELEDDEKVEYVLKPYLIVVFLQNILRSILLIVIVPLFILIIDIIRFLITKNSLINNFSIMPTLWVLFFTIILAIITGIGHYFGLKYSYYLITNKNIIFLKTINPDKIDIVKMDKILGKALERNFIDRYFNTANIKIDTGKTCLDEGSEVKSFDYLYSIRNFEIIFKNL